jgi:geranylgeranyl reductase family protein
VVRRDALIVGGGPAGSTCARVLTRAGWNVLVLDRAQFPRDKVCAGWVTPGVFRLLELDPADYRATGLTMQAIRGFRTSVLDSAPMGRQSAGDRGAASLDTQYPGIVSYAIRRVEFDDYLLTRSRAEVRDGVPVGSIERRADRWVINGEFEAPVLVGAGGHFCPIARHLRGGGDDTRPVVAKEAEFRLTSHSTVAADTPELFFCRDLEGYGWCVRKGEYLNIGIGRRDHGDLNEHVRDFTSFLEQTGKAVDAAAVRWRGHAYLAWGTGPRPLVDDGVMVAGDAAGLAYPESGEGIKPAVESGRLAAETLLAAGGRTDREALEPYAAAMSRRYPPARRTPHALAPVLTSLGRRLLRSRTFTRKVVIERWFLRK